MGAESATCLEHVRRHKLLRAGGLSSSQALVEELQLTSPLVDLPDGTQVCLGNVVVQRREVCPLLPSQLSCKEVTDLGGGDTKRCPLAVVPEPQRAGLGVLDSGLLRLLEDEPEKQSKDQLT